MLRAIRAGTSRRLPDGPPKRRVRKQLLQKLLKAAIKEDRLWMGAALCLAYVFALRVPSELLGQGRNEQFKVYSDRVCLVSLKRKGRVGLSELVRSCTCRTNPLMCPHPWLAYASRRTPEGKLFDMSPATFHAEFRDLLRKVGVPASEAEQYTSHALRRGVAVDILEQHGLQAMLAYGDWKSVTSASHYASLDEMDRFVVGAMAADASDDDN